MNQCMRKKLFKLVNEAFADDQDSKVNLFKPLVEISGKLPSRLIAAAADRIRPRRNYRQI